MDPGIISAAILALVGLAGTLTAWLTASDKRRRRRLKKLDRQNVDLFGYVYVLRSLIASRLGPDALPPAPESLDMDGDDYDR